MLKVCSLQALLANHTEKQWVDMFRSAGIFAVPAKKLFYAIRDWKGSLLGSTLSYSKVPALFCNDKDKTESIHEEAHLEFTFLQDSKEALLAAEKVANIDTLQKQINIEIQLLDWINEVLLSHQSRTVSNIASINEEENSSVVVANAVFSQNNGCRMSPKALRLLMLSKEDHQARIKRLKLIIREKVLAKKTRFVKLLLPEEALSLVVQASSNQKKKRNRSGEELQCAEATSDTSRKKKQIL